MKVEYCIEPTVDVYLDPASAIREKMHLDGADVNFEISEDNLLKNLKVVFTGLPIKLQKGGGRDGKDTVINPSYPEIHDKASRILSFLVNFIQAQGGQRPISNLWC